MKNILSVLFLLTVGISSGAQQTRFSKTQIDSMQQLSTTHKNVGVGMIVGGSVFIVGGLASWLKAIEISVDEDWNGGHEEGNQGVFIALGIVGYGVGIPLLISGIRRVSKAYKINKVLQNANISMSAQSVPFTAGGGQIYSTPQTSVTLKIPFGK